MEVIKAIQRLGWRFSEATKNGNMFTVNQNDLDALSGIATYVEQAQNKQFQENELFAKLYIKVYLKMIEHYKTDIFDTEPRRQMIKILETPIENVMQEFTDRLNDSEKYVRINTLGVDLKHPALRNDKETTRYNEKIKSLLKTSNLEDVILKDVWGLEDVKGCLIIEVNNAININRLI